MYVIEAGGFYWNGKGFGGFGLAKRYSTHNKAVLGVKVAKGFTSASPNISDWETCYDKEYEQPKQDPTPLSDAGFSAICHYGGSK